jgi:hypothetical protein
MFPNSLNVNFPKVLKIGARNSEEFFFVHPLFHRGSRIWGCFKTTLFLSNSLFYALDIVYYRHVPQSCAKTDSSEFVYDDLAKELEFWSGIS